MKENSFYAYCDHYFPQCYYSDGNPIDVMPTSAANNFCKSVNEKGRLLDFDVASEINKVKTFLANYSMHKVLLNAKNENGRWKWIQQGNGEWSIFELHFICLEVTFQCMNTFIDITKNNNLKTKGEQLFYMLQPDNSEKFYVVCKTGKYVEFGDLK